MKTTKKRMAAWTATFLVGTMVVAFIPIQSPFEERLQLQDPEAITAKGQQAQRQETKTASSPGFADYYVKLSVSLVKKDYPQALLEVNQCLALYTGESKDVLSDLWLKKAGLAVLTGDAKGAVEAADYALGVDSTLDQALLIKSQGLASLGQNPEALVALDAYIKDETQAAEYRVYRAQLLHATGQWLLAAKEISLLEAEGKAMPEHINLRADSYVQLKDYEHAEQDLTYCIQNGYQTEESHYFRGICRLMQGKQQEAAEDFALAGQSHKDARYLQALSLYEAKDYRAALPLFEQEVAAGTQDAYFYLAVCLIQAEDYVKAEEMLTQAIHHGVMLPQSYFNRGLCRAKLDNEDGSISDFEHAKLQNEDEDIRLGATEVLNEVKRLKDEIDRRGTRPPQSDYWPSLSP